MWGPNYLRLHNIVYPLFYTAAAHDNNFDFLNPKSVRGSGENAALEKVLKFFTNFALYFETQ